MNKDGKIFCKTELFNKHPNLLKKYTNFSIKRGWFSLVDSLCCELNEYIENGEDNYNEDCYIIQLKEKFGKLKCYVTEDFQTGEVLVTIDKYENNSIHICQECGDSSPEDVFETLCKNCRDSKRR